MSASCSKQLFANQPRLRRAGYYFLWCSQFLHHKTGMPSHYAADPQHIAGSDLRGAMALAIFADNGIGFLPSVDIARCRQLSSVFKAYSSTNAIWREVYVRDFGVPSSDLQRMMHLAMHSSRRLFGSRNAQNSGAGTEPGAVRGGSASAPPTLPRDAHAPVPGQAGFSRPDGTYIIQVGSRSGMQTSTAAAAARGGGSASQGYAGLYGHQSTPLPIGSSAQQHNAGSSRADPRGPKQQQASAAAPMYPTSVPATSGWPAPANGYAYMNVYAGSNTPYVYAQQVPESVPVRTQERMLSEALGGSGSKHKHDPDAWRAAYRSTYLQKLHFNQLPVWLLVQRHEAALLRRRRRGSAGQSGTGPPGHPPAYPLGPLPHFDLPSTDSQGGTPAAEQEEAPDASGSPPVEASYAPPPVSSSKSTADKLKAAALLCVAGLFSVSAVLLAARNDCLDEFPAVWAGPGLGLVDAKAREECSGNLGPHGAWLSCFAGCAMFSAVALSLFSADHVFHEEWHERRRTQLLTVATVSLAVLLQILLLDFKNANVLDIAWGTALLPLWIMMGVAAMLTCYAHYRLYRKGLYPFTLLAPFLGIAVPMMVIAQRLDEETGRLAALGLKSGVVATGVISTDDPYAFPMIAFWIFIGLPSILGTAFLTVDAGTGQLSTGKQKLQMVALLLVATLTMLLSCNVAAADGQVLNSDSSKGQSWHEVLWPLYVLPWGCLCVVGLFCW